MKKKHVICSQYLSIRQYYVALDLKTYKPFLGKLSNRKGYFRTVFSVLFFYAVQE